MKYYRGEALSGHPNFPEGSAALCQSVSLPVEISAPEITYTKEDDDAIDVFLRETGTGGLYFDDDCHRHL